MVPNYRLLLRLAFFVEPDRGWPEENMVQPGPDPRPPFWETSGSMGGLEARFLLFEVGPNKRWHRSLLGFPVEPTNNRVQGTLRRRRPFQVLDLLCRISRDAAIGIEAMSFHSES